MLSLHNIINDLENKMGRDFEKTVAEAFNFLGLEAEWIRRTQAESDVLARAGYPTSPYIVVAECSAVRLGSQVGYGKAGQVRGAYSKYVAKYGALYKRAYKVIIGKPEFSSDLISTAKESKDIKLIEAPMLIELLKNHNQFQFSQDELESVFMVQGDTVKFSNSELRNFVEPYSRKCTLYAIVLTALTRNCRDTLLKERSGLVPIPKLIERVHMLGLFSFDIELSDEETYKAIVELSSPFAKVLNIELADSIEHVKLSAFTPTQILSNMGRFQTALSVELARLNDRLDRLKLIQRTT